MQRRLLSLAPLLACVLLLHLGFAFATALPGPATTHTRVSDAAPPRTDPPVRTTRDGVASRSDSVRLEAHLPVTTLGAPTGQSPQRTVVANFDGKACGSVTRPGRNNPTSDRRDPVGQEACAPPDAPLRRANTADGRPLSTVTGPDPIRSSVLRC
ncbi:hypothetical protein [Micromonospora sp. RTGN7]|uniref:hypothetical protein n=1 Tax=Micromonospora sp. RTGN7 TaxID=3016526 RepID=UPI0029FF3AC6|nr:hypothetical protein [Micromonospora sp. RTGN7]